MPADLPPDRAVVDQIVDGVTALLLVGPDEVPLHVPVGDLPDGATEGTWVVLDLCADPVTVTGIDAALTASRSAAIEDRLARLREQRGSGRFGS